MHAFTFVAALLFAGCLTSNTIEGSWSIGPIESGGCPPGGRVYIEVKQAWVAHWTPCEDGGFSINVGTDVPDFTLELGVQGDDGSWRIGGARLELRSVTDDFHVGRVTFTAKGS